MGGWGGALSARDQGRSRGPQAPNQRHAGAASSSALVSGSDAETAVLGRPLPAALALGALLWCPAQMHAAGATLPAGHPLTVSRPPSTSRVTVAFLAAASSSSLEANVACGQPISAASI